MSPERDLPDTRTLRARQATSFGAAADAYERARPGYPAAAADWALPVGARAVLDLGAGTGKFTRALTGRGLQITAVEPLPEMREQLARAVPGARVLAGTAEELPLPDASVDAVVCAQAWHWVDVERACPEVARVLRPGGVLALVWNVRDTREGWALAFDRLLDAAQGRQDMTEDAPLLAAPFGPREHRTFTWAQPMTAESLIDLAASRSYAITATEDQRRSLFAAVRELTTTHPDLVGRETFDLGYTTHVTRAVLP